MTFTSSRHNCINKPPATTNDSMVKYKLGRGHFEMKLMLETKAPSQPLRKVFASSQRSYLPVASGISLFLDKIQHKGKCSVPGEWGSR